ncbi:MAG: CopG family transcriptional regulator [uncultured Sulfurovum sp.]|uniref:CopG family transcriptional regulator n=1 Tax=uncultured Sulfurovum sp. TaxID=269237 RepID=A0A6S6SJN0_9BACT|nr:MAG: CopG family transcriptional regulator [uncultured Sulfurovum sp.]
MTATVRLDDVLSDKLNQLSHSLHKKKSDVIRDAIEFYAKNIESDKKSKMLSAVEKVKKIDKSLNKEFEVTLSDGI